MWSETGQKKVRACQFDQSFERSPCLKHILGKDPRSPPLTFFLDTCIFRFGPPPVLPLALQTRLTPQLLPPTVSTMRMKQTTQQTLARSAGTQTRAVKAICLKDTEVQEVVQRQLRNTQNTSIAKRAATVSQNEPARTSNMVNQATGVKATRVQKRIRKNRRLSQIQQPHAQITVLESANVPKPSPTKPRVLLYVFWRTVARS